jgi:AcrR family transcriptional regulator
VAERGLRERKKQETRRHISNVATHLIALRGFENVTVADVAEAADVSRMTVFNYFPRKEDLYLDRHADRVAALAAAIGEREPGESVVTALRRHHHELLAAEHPLSGAIAGAAGFYRVLYASPALVSRMHEQGQEIDDAIAEVLVAEGEEPVRARLVAGLVGATVRTVFACAVRRIVAGDDAAAVRRDQVEVIDQAFDLLERGIGPYGGESEPGSRPDG